MAATYNDKDMLTTDVQFQKRVRQSLIQQAGNIMTEAVTTSFHRERSRYAAAVLNAPLNYLTIFVGVVANDPTVISDATAAGTVVLTSGNVAAQAALVTDAHIDTAISANFNSFFLTPAP